MAKKKSEITSKSIKKTQDKITIIMKKEKGEVIKAEAKKEGKSINAFIIDIVMKYIEDKNKTE